MSMQEIFELLDPVILERVKYKTEKETVCVLCNKDSEVTRIDSFGFEKAGTVCIPCIKKVVMELIKNRFTLEAVRLAKK